MDDVEKKIKILHVSGATLNSGAGYAAMLTHNALLNINVESKVLYLKELGTLGQNVASYSASGFNARISRLLNTTLERMLIFFNRKKGGGIFSPGFFGVNLKAHPLFEWADIIHVHWANYGFVNIKDIALWKKPVVWTLRDMWAFTGGCHYSLECSRYKDSCGRCPMLNGDNEQDLSYYGLIRKFEFLSQANINWVAVSQLMRADALQSKVLGNQEIEVVYSGVNCDSYEIHTKDYARSILGLPKDQKIILIGSANIRDEYKGFSYIQAALRKLPSNILVIAFGAAELKNHEIPQKIINFGFINETIKLNLLYCSADIFLSPSLNEAFGKTFAEAQVSGLPVICFKNTGPEEIVEHLITGYAANYKDGEDLVCGIEWAISFNFDRNYIRDRAIRLFNIRESAEKYKALYQKLLSR
ncbi:glycosyltransferase [Polynucleobacter sp. 73C-SIWE]|uniref:glycosyltransferase n=1 Tax=Polynucleobacter sp. 73C-SIWE TaxID=2689098 RepID=UPI001C0BEB44|nr:glycosyltransferase [Polynucleobacter sp. 73C-SIWE]MBU3578641.1 glycosyltransferase [Polynucleobacter sp. 73C-SIWE]